MSDLLKDMKHPMQPIGFTDDNIIRFKRNAIIRDMYEAFPGKMNAIVIAYHKGEYSLEDLVQLYQLIGYSVSGFGELSQVPGDVVDLADSIADALRAWRASGEEVVAPPPDGVRGDPEGGADGR